MSMTKAEVLQAFRESALHHIYLDNADENNLHHSFSHKYQQKMTKLIKHEKNILWRMSNTFQKKVCIVAMALIIIVSSSYDAIAWGKNAVSFIIEKYEEYYNYRFESDVQKHITKTYLIGSLPQGYELTEEVRTESINITKYQDSQMNSIMFSQEITNGTNFTIDSKNEEEFIKKINGIDISFFIQEKMIQALWINDGYYFRLSCQGDLTLQNVIDIIEAIK